MKARSSGKKYKAGFSTLEILIAFAVVILCMGAVIMVTFGNQSIGIDSETNLEAIYKAQAVLEKARALSRENFAGLISTSSVTTSGIPYTQSLVISDVTLCRKQATSTVTWYSSSRPQKVEFSTFFSDIAGSLALGGDCPTDEAGPNWNNPQKFASDTINPGKSTAIDVLNKVAYLGADMSPYLYIASTTYAVLGQSNNLFVTFTNGFEAEDEINSLDAIRDLASGKYYLFSAMASSTLQLKVTNVTDIYNPVTVARVGLSSCVTGSFPEGWRLYYYKNTLYLTTRYTAGPELHIFNVTNPESPVEYSIGSISCKGLNLGDTANNMVVTDQVVGGVTKRYLYLATSELDKELRVFDVTNPTLPIEILAANQDLPGPQDGLSVYLYGNKLFLGRQSTPSGADLYVYDISNPTTGLPLLGSKDIGTGVNQIRVTGRFAFLGTPKSNQEFQVWDVSNLSSISLLKAYNFGNIVEQGLDYEPDRIYATGQASPNFQMLYNP